MTAGQPITSFEQARLTDSLVFAMVRLGKPGQDIIVALCERHRQMVEKELERAGKIPIIVERYEPERPPYYEGYDE